MTLATTTAIAEQSGNGVSLAFTFAFKYIAAADLKVYLYDEEEFEPTLQTITTHYTVTPTGAATNGVYPGATITFVSAPSATEIVRIFRDPTLTQEFDFDQENDPLPVLTRHADLEAMRFQAVLEKLGQTIRVGDGVPGFNGEIAGPFTPGYAPVVNDAGDGWDMAPTDSIISDAMTAPMQQTTRAAGAFLLGVPWFDPSWPPYSADNTGVSDASSALASALAAAESAKRSVLVQGALLVGASPITGDNISLVGFGGDEALYPYTDGPSQLRVTNASNSPFMIGESVSLSGVTLIYPNQVESTTAPIVYPPTFTNQDDETQVVGFKLDHFTVIGATTLCRFGSLEEYEKAGQLALRGVRAFCTATYLDITHCPDVIHADHCTWGLHVYGDEVSHYGAAGAGGILSVTSITRSGTTATVTTAVAHGRLTGANVTISGAVETDYNVANAEITVTGSDTFTYQVANSPSTPATGTIKANIFPLRGTHRNNAVWVRVWGDGTTSSLSTVSVDGVMAVNNSFLGFECIFDVVGEGDAAGEDGGFLQIVSLSGGAVDQTQTLLRVQPGGACYDFVAAGFTGYQERSGDPTWFGYFIDIEDPAPAAGSATLTEVHIGDAEMGYMRGGLATITGDYVERVSVTDFSCPDCIHTTENGDRVFIVLDAPNADIILNMNRVCASRAATGKRTFCQITNARSVTIEGAFDNWDHIIENNSATCKVSFRGKTFNDQDDAITGTYAGNVKVSSDSYIESMPTLSQPAGDNALINGSFEVNQEGTSFTSGAIQWASDMWKVTRASAATGATFSRQTGFSRAQFCWRMARDNGNSGTEALFMCQQMFGDDARRYQGTHYFVGIDARKGADFSEADGELTVTVHTGTASSTETVNVSTGYATGNVSQSKSLPLSTTEGRLVFGPFEIPTNATSISVVEHFTPVGTAGAADYAEVTNISGGNLATAQSFPFRSGREEIDLCEAFFEKNIAIGTKVIQNLGAGGTRFRACITGAVDDGLWVPFRVRKRSGTPVVTIFNPNASNAQIRNITRSQDFASTTANDVTQCGFQASGTGSASTVPGDTCEFHWTADSRIGP